MTAPLALYCKSYRTDLLRVARLAQSIQQFNLDKIPFFVSVPADDFALFKQYFVSSDVQIVSDADIIACNPRIDPLALQALPGGTSQQIVKSEFWRLALSEAYLCLDSDAVFIHPFKRSDYLLEDGTPYTVLDEGHEFLETALLANKPAVIQEFRKISREVQTLFDRKGRTYSFGPFPVLWHRAVWQSLDHEYLQPRSMNFMDAIIQAPAESHWYGESLLKYKAISLMPCQPLFKVYHYAWQLDQDRRRGVGETELSTLYCGVIYQSAWERELDWPQEGGGLLSRFGRRIRRKLGRV